MATVCFGWYKATVHLLKSDKNGEGELPINEARNQYPTLAEWIKKLSRVKSKFPAWLVPLSPHHLGLAEAEESFDVLSATKIREAAKIMLERFEHFLAKDTEIHSDKAQNMPHTNDYVEGAHGTVSALMERMPNANPLRTASIAQRKHNQAASRALNVPLVPSPNTLRRYKDESHLENNESVMRRVHKTAMEQQLRTQFKGMGLAQLRERAETMDLDSENTTRSQLIEALIEASYEPPPVTVPRTLTF